MLAIIILVMLAAISPFAVAENLVADTQSENTPVSTDGQPDSTPADTDEEPSGTPVYINGQPVELSVSPSILSGTTYIPLREFSVAMGAESVTWHNGTTTVVAPNLTMQITAGNIYLVANGRYLIIPNGCLLANGTLMVPIRTLAKAFNATVLWEASSRAVYITTGSGGITPGSSFYDETDLLWMSRIISAEARGESLFGKIAVGSVIMNRVASPSFPNTVYAVIFDKQYGVQFSPAYSGAIYNTPSEECIIAAKIALDGGSTAGNSLYFSSTTQCWAAKARPFAMTIGNHNFFA